MGDYATTTSISELMPQYLVGNTTTSDTAGAALFSRHIDRAEGIVKSYLSARYSVSGFSPIPPMVRTLSEDIASWFAARAAYVQDGGRRQEYLDAFERALETLEDIRDGKTKLAYTNGSEVPPVSSSRYLSSTEGYSHIFNLDDPKTWAVDQDQIDDMTDARS